MTAPMPVTDPSISDVETTAVTPDLGADDDWDRPLPPVARPGQRRLRRVTAGLAGLLLLIAGFIVGIQVEKRSATPTAAAATLTPTGASATGRGGRFAGGFGGGGVVVGTIKVIDGSTLYVTEASGNTVAVKTAGAAISITNAGGLAQVHPGQTVLVRGTAATNGSISARSVSVGVTGLFGGGFGGVGAAAGGTGPAAGPTGAPTRPAGGATKATHGTKKKAAGG